MYIISVVGRKDLGTGILRNRTDGGEGPSNPGEETRRKIKEKRANQVFTEDTRKKLSDLHKGKPKLHFRKHFKLIDPNRKLVNGFGIKPFCEENNLNYDSIRKVLSGIKSHHKGWIKPIDYINT